MRDSGSNETDNEPQPKNGYPFNRRFHSAGRRSVVQKGFDSEISTKSSCAGLAGGSLRGRPEKDRASIAMHHVAPILRLPSRIRRYDNLQKRYRNILTRGDKELPPIPARQNGKRGRVDKSDAHNQWERLKEHESAVLHFAKGPFVTFTNSRAERDLRMSTVKQKVSRCFRKREYAEAYCRISSYLQSMANRGYNPLAAPQMVLSGKLYAEPGDWLHQGSDYAVIAKSPGRRPCHPGRGARKDR